MQLVNTLFVVLSFGLIRANYIRVNNTGTQNLILTIESEKFGPDNGTLIEAGNFSDFFTLNEFRGSFYTYPEECLTTVCEYPVTKINVVFEDYIFDNFYDFLMIDLNRGFNVPASIKSLSRSDCGVISCDVNLLELCSEEDQITNENGEVVACQTSELNYQDFKAKCPKARVDGPDLTLGICASMDYELTFG